MAYLQPKAQKGQAWIPSQVAYGVDCTDPDPKNWKPFGELHDRAEASQAAANQKTSSKDARGPLAPPAGP